MSTRMLDMSAPAWNCARRSNANAPSGSSKTRVFRSASGRSVADRPLLVAAMLVAALVLRFVVFSVVCFVRESAVVEIRSAPIDRESTFSFDFRRQWTRAGRVQPAFHYKTVTQNVTERFTIVQVPRPGNETLQIFGCSFKFTLLVEFRPRLE